MENCRLAILNASQKKKKRKMVKEVLDNLEYYANDLSERMSRMDFLSPYKTRIIKDGLSGKERELQVPAFYPDQCAHHAIMQILKPIIEKSSYRWSCANIPNRGIDLACKGVERATVRDRKHAKYCVKMDISKFYPSIPHGKLKARLREKIKDEKALQIIFKVIDSHNPGLPIGNYTSPWLAELYLQPLDYLIKQKHRIRHYIRYADDLVLIDSNKRKLRKALHDIFLFVEELGMTVKHDYQLFRIQPYCKERTGRRGTKDRFRREVFRNWFYHHPKEKGVGTYAAEQVYSKATAAEPACLIQNGFRVSLPVRLFQAHQLIRHEEKVLRNGQHQKVKGGCQQ